MSADEPRKTSSFEFAARSSAYTWAASVLFVLLGRIVQILFQPGLDHYVIELRNTTANLSPCTFDMQATINIWVDGPEGLLAAVMVRTHHFCLDTQSCESSPTKGAYLRAENRVARQKGFGLTPRTSPYHILIDIYFIEFLLDVLLYPATPHFCQKPPGTDIHRHPAICGGPVHIQHLALEMSSRRTDLDARGSRSVGDRLRLMLDELKAFVLDDGSNVDNNTMMAGWR
ncbi:hypothetical protein B0I35DRAFT_404912 [Stachybotrys elegans]|uniref:Uncharacterized protein n=1 Tax=Stachybotrys elegans TaxID=80388 RepID=A0A8K0T9E9_9HYPO|nr:hypothetical protein B0I35DRAFT_404912 [Stachybotrys elegans]